MIPRLVPALAGSALLGSLAVLAVARAAPAGGRAAPRDAALNHWVLDARDMERVEVRRFAQEYVAHLREAHPEVALTVYTEFLEQHGNRVHFLLEAVNSTAQQAFLAAPPGDDLCRALAAREQADFVVGRDAYLRLVAADPEKEERAGTQEGLIVWELDAHLPRVGQALECVEALVRHLNATYETVLCRGYDEWFPRSGRLRIHFYGTGISTWERFEAQMRRDPVVRQLFEGAAEAFVEGAFEDTWMVRLAGG